MYYLERTPLYDVEKPYTMRYEPNEEEGIPQTNFVKVKKPLTVRSMRHSFPYSFSDNSSPAPDSGSSGAENAEDKSGLFKLEECGFQKIRLESQLTYEEFWDNEKVQETYVQEVKSALKRELGAKYVFVLDYAVSILYFIMIWPYSDYSPLRGIIRCLGRGGLGRGDGKRGDLLCCGINVVFV